MRAYKSVGTVFVVTGALAFVAAFFDYTATAQALAFLSGGLFMTAMLIALWSLP